MPGTAPAPRFLEFDCSGVLNEWNDPAGFGMHLTDCSNLIYHRNGAWGRRPGATLTPLPQGGSTTPVSAFRWYRAFPTPLTKLVTYSQGILCMGNDAASLTEIGAFALSGSTAPGVATARDPQAASGNGADILIITGLVLPTGSPATGAITITGLPGALPVGSWIQITTTSGANTVTTSRYNLTGADNPESIANGLVTLVNETAAFLNQGSYNPWLGESYYTQPNPMQSNTGVAAVPQAIIHMGALLGGSAGNSITYGIAWSDGSDTGTTLAMYIGTDSGEVSVPADGAQHSVSMTGGGQSWSGPARIDNPQSATPTVQALTFHAANAFEFCVSWHNHVWYWGDPNNPVTVFASDINQPEAFSFMFENGGMNAKGNSTQNGGYTVNAGDGDPIVQSCVPIGNALYIFKTSNIYMIEGYNFQVGEYAFSVEPQVVGYGIPNPYCAGVLDEQVVFWSGLKFCRLSVGSYEVEHIGLPIPITEGLCSTAHQPDVRMVTGDLQAKTLLNNVFLNGQPGGTAATVIYRNLAIFSFVGNGVALNVVYDDEKSASVGGYAWTKWYGWNIGCWVRYGFGPAPTGNNTDKPIIGFIDPAGANFYNAGASGAYDFGNMTPIPWMAQTSWIDGGTPELLKYARVVYANANATAGATLTADLVPGQIIPPGPINPPGVVSQYGTEPMTATFNPTVAPSYCEALNNLKQYVNTGQTQGQLPIQAKAFLMQWTEPGTAGAGFELRKFGIDVEEEALAT